MSLIRGEVECVTCDHPRCDWEQLLYKLHLCNTETMDSSRPGETLIFDNLDIDLLVKVLENTAFSMSPQ